MSMGGVALKQKSSTSNQNLSTSYPKCSSECYIPLHNDAPIVQTSAHQEQSSSGKGKVKSQAQVLSNLSIES
eukprot:4851552-Amphidinium_carterae.1